MGAYPGIYARTYTPSHNDASGLYLAPGSYPVLSAMLYNRIQSLTVAPNTEVTLFDATNFRGDRVTYTNRGARPLVVMNIGTLSNRAKSLLIRKL